MTITTADALLKYAIYLLPGTCVNFEPTRKMLEKFTSEQFYVSEFVDEVLDAMVDTNE